MKLLNKYKPCCEVKVVYKQRVYPEQEDENNMEAAQQLLFLL